MIPVLIVLYEPDESQLSRIAHVQNDVNLYVFDNSGADNSSSFPKAEYFHASNNLGIAGALFWMLNVGRERRLEHFLFFDQDTLFDRDTIATIEAKVAQAEARTGILHFKSSHRRLGPVRFVINSGSVFRIAPLQLIASSIADYFVDALDLAICHHLRTRGFRIIQNYAPNIDHVSGQGFKTVQIWNRAFQVKPYTPVRRKGFMAAHLKLLGQCLRNFSLLDALHLVCFAVYFSVDQRRTDLLLRRGVVR
jgi:hypothetical protein